MKKLCLTLLIFASLAGAAPPDPCHANCRMLGLWTHPVPPDPGILPVFVWLAVHRFFTMF